MPCCSRPQDPVWCVATAAREGISSSAAPPVIGSARWRAGLERSSSTTAVCESGSSGEGEGIEIAEALIIILRR